MTCDCTCKSAFLNIFPVISASKHWTRARFRCCHGNTGQTNLRSIFFSVRVAFLHGFNPPVRCIFIIFANNFIQEDAMNPRLLLAFKTDDSSTDLRLQTDVNSQRGDENVTCGSFHLGCCAGVSCGPPLHVANGVVRGAVFQFGDVAVYSCFGGYAMQGIGRSRCLENGTWTPPPTCRGRASVTDRREPLSLSFSLSPPPSNFICFALLWAPPALHQIYFTNLDVLLLDCTKKLVTQ